MHQNIEKNCALHFGELWGDKICQPWTFFSAKNVSFILGKFFENKIGTQKLIIQTKNIQKYYFSKNNLMEMSFFFHQTMQ